MVNKDYQNRDKMRPEIWIVNNYESRIHWERYATNCWHCWEKKSSHLFTSLLVLMQRGYDICVQTGACECKPGYRGDDCGRRCDDGYYGNRCEGRCNCRQGETCDFVTGTCYTNCPPGWIGQHCDRGNTIIPINLVCSIVLRVWVALRGHRVS